MNLPSHRIRFAVAALSLLTFVASANAELVLQKVRPERIFYKPGEQIVVDIEIANPASVAATAQLSVALIHDLDTTTNIGDQSVTVAPGKTETVKVNAKAEEWLGIEARATLSRDGKTIATQSDYFTCARNVAQVLIPGYSILMMGNVPDDKVGPQVAYHTHISRDQLYGNWIECFAWGPSDYDDLTPDVDRFWSGQTSYNESTSNLKALLKSLKDQGTQVATYAKAGGGGPATFEFFRKQPELAMYNEAGRPTFEGYSAAYIDWLDVIGGPKKNAERGVPGTPDEMEKEGYTGSAWFTPYTKGGMAINSIWYDGNDPRVIQHHGEELARSSEQLGFDAVRYDGEFFTSRHRLFDGSWNAEPNFDTDVSEAKMVRNLKEIARKAKSDYIFAFNTHCDFRWNVKAGNAPKAFREKCKDGGIIGQEELAFPGNVPWEDYIKIMRHNADLTRYYGGYHCAFPFIRNPRVLYDFIIAYALRSHQMMYFTHGTKLPGGDVHIAKFATRFASFLWDDGLRGWDAAENEVDVKSSRKIWWSQFAAAKPMSVTGSANTAGTQFILHLINAPDGKLTLGEKASDTDAEKVCPLSMPSAPADDVVVRWKKPRDFKRAMIADVDRCDLQPIVAKTEGDELVMTIPQIKHWSILVIESGAKTPDAVWTATAEETNMKLPSAAELGLVATATSAQTPLGEQYTAQTEDSFPSPSGTTDLVKELDAKGGASVHAQPDRPKTYMVLLPYFFPRVPGKYVAHFRLKVADNTSDKPVVSLQVSHTIEHPTRIAPYLHSKLVTITGRDFEKPNVYQDFDVPFEHGDVGFRGVGCQYEGNNEVWWDQATVDLVEPWKNEDLDRYYSSLRPPAKLAFNHDDKLDVVLVRGLWNRLYKLDDALAKISGPVNVTNAYTAYSIFTDTQFTGFTLDWEPLFNQDVMVLANVETRGIGLGQTKMVKKWVDQGGGLVVLGGIVTLGQSYNMERGWADMLPVEMKMPFEVAKCDPAVELGKTDPSLQVDSSAWQKNAPVILYRHMVKAKPGATVLLAGKNGEPLLVGGQFGKGRVVVFTGTVLGEPKEGQTPFWKSETWPQILATAVKWSHGK